MHDSANQQSSPILNEDLVESADCTQLYIRLSRCIVKYCCAWGQDIIKNLGFGWIYWFLSKVNFDSTRRKLLKYYICILMRKHVVHKIAIETVWNMIRRGAILLFLYVRLFPYREKFLVRNIVRDIECSLRYFTHGSAFRYGSSALNSRCVLGNSYSLGEGTAARAMIQR